MKVLQNKRLFLLACLLSFYPNQANPQKKPACQTISMSGPAGILPPGVAGRWIVSAGDDSVLKEAKFKWSVSQGSIKSGQGTREIEYIQETSSVTVSVEIAGLPDGCPTLLSESSIVDPAPQARGIGELQGLLNAKVLQRISEKIKSERSLVDRVYIFVSGAKNNTVGTRNKKVAALQGLFKADPSFVTFVLDDQPTDLIEVWIVPPGADNPTPKRPAVPTFGKPSTSKP